jgi:hypothetical protein
MTIGRSIGDFPPFAPFLFLPFLFQKTLFVQSLVLGAPPDSCLLL